MLTREVTIQSALTMTRCVPYSAAAAGACYLGARFAILSINPNKAAILGAKIASAYVIQSLVVLILSKVPSVSQEVNQFPAEVRPILFCGLRAGQLAVPAFIFMWDSPVKLIIDTATVVGGSILLVQINLMVLKKAKNVAIDYYSAMVQSEETLKVIADAKACREAIQPAKQLIREKSKSLQALAKELGLEFSKDRKENDDKITSKKTIVMVELTDAESKDAQSVKEEKQKLLNKLDTLSDGLVSLRAVHQKFNQTALEQKNLWLAKEKALRTEIQTLATTCKFAFGKADIESNMMKEWKRLRDLKLAASDAELETAQNNMTNFELLWNKVIQLRIVLSLLSQMEA